MRMQLEAVLRAEVAKGALRVLARAATGLPTQQVVRLLLEMARAGMGQELNALAAVLSAPGVRKAPEVVALAAAVAPDEALCQQTLQQAGLVALAACFTYNWCANCDELQRLHVDKHIVLTQQVHRRVFPVWPPHDHMCRDIQLPDDNPSRIFHVVGAGGQATLCKLSRSGSSS